MTSMSVSISKAADTDVPKVQEFLRSHAETSMFLASNLSAYGPALSQSANSGNFKYLQQDGQVVGVFCLTRRGNLLAETGKNTEFALTIIEACRDEPIRIAGVVGEWTLADAIWSILIESGDIAEVIIESREPLYRLILERSPATFRPSAVRMLTPSYFAEWELLNDAYLREEGIPIQLSTDEKLANFSRECASGQWWGLPENGRLVAIGALNAVHDSMGQIGGVYTIPELRRLGRATSVMKALISDCIAVHELRRLFLFTGERNRAAQRLYESLGFRRIGEFALLFGKPAGTAT
jgi:ribosomal protein S18 acetylase RimI-like enzyme